MPSADCPICRTPLSTLADTVVLERHAATYCRCPDCGLVCLPEPHWLEEAYGSAIAFTDVGLLRRCRILSGLTSLVIRTEGLAGQDFLDWAGGYGTLTRLMRDKGHAFFTEDAYCENLFAREYEAAPGSSFALATAFEVVEHLADPVAELRDLSERTDLLLFTTELLPSDPPPAPDAWPYYAPETGQHIMFHTVDSLRRLGAQLGYELTSNGHQYHLFHRRALRPATRLLLSPHLGRAKTQTLAGLRRLRPGFAGGGLSTELAGLRSRT